MRSAGSGTKRADGQWQTCVTVTLPDGTKRREWIVRATQGEMIEARRAYLARHGRRGRQKTTLADVFARFELEHLARKSESTRDNHRWTWKEIGREFGTRPVDRLDAPAIDAFLHRISLMPRKRSGVLPKGEAKGAGGAGGVVSGRTVQLHRTNLSALLSFAVRKGLLTANPAREVPLPVSAKPRRRPRITPGAYRWMIMKARAEGFRHRSERPNDKSPILGLAVALRLMGECGLRPSEAAAARRADVRTSRGVAWLAVRGTKTEAAPRDVPLPLALLWEWDRAEADPPPTYDALEREWKRLWRGVRPRGMSMHGLRKFALTRWADRGIPDTVLKLWAGHANIELTKQVYIGVSEGRQISALRSAGMTSEYADPLGAAASTGTGTPS